MDIPPRLAPLLEQYDWGCLRLINRMTGPEVDSGNGSPVPVPPMTTAEYLWEPVPGAWSVRRRADGPGPRATLAGRRGGLGQGRLPRHRAVPAAVHHDRLAAQPPQRDARAARRLHRGQPVADQGRLRDERGRGQRHRRIRPAPSRRGATRCCAATTPRSTPSATAATPTAATPGTCSSTSFGGSTRRCCTTAVRSPCSATSTGRAQACTAGQETTFTVAGLAAVRLVPAGCTAGAFAAGAGFAACAVAAALAGVLAAGARRFSLA